MRQRKTNQQLHYPIISYIISKIFSDVKGLLLCLLGLLLLCCAAQNEGALL